MVKIFHWNTNSVYSLITTSLIFVLNIIHGVFTTSLLRKNQLVIFNFFSEKRYTTAILIFEILMLIACGIDTQGNQKCSTRIQRTLGMDECNKFRGNSLASYNNNCCWTRLFMRTDYNVTNYKRYCNIKTILKSNGVH